jgi:hypothetical protein
MPMINETPESRFEGILKPFFDCIDPQLPSCVTRAFAMQHLFINFSR